VATPVEDQRAIPPKQIGLPAKLSVGEGIASLGD
jgi:hypothetical protein